MTKTWQVDCDFKINLCLNITGKLENAYHSLDSVFLRLKGGDKLYLQLILPKQGINESVVQAQTSDDVLQNYRLQIFNKLDLMGKPVITSEQLTSLQSAIERNLVTKAWLYIREICVHSLIHSLPEFLTNSESLRLELRPAQLRTSAKLKTYWRTFKPCTLKFYLALFNSATWKFSLEKYMPTQAGLGAGSFDAAAVWQLVYMALLDLAKDTKMAMSLVDFIACFDLTDIAYNLGADIPFALQTDYQLAFVSGIGEKVTSLYNATKAYFLLVKPKFAINTKQAFQTFDLVMQNNVETLRDINHAALTPLVLTAWQKRDFFNLAKYAHNSFYTLANLTDQRLIIFKQHLEHELFADFVSMSGSGSAFYLLYATQEGLDLALDMLLSKNVNAKLLANISWIYQSYF